MNKQILRKVFLIIFPLVFVGVAAYFFVLIRVNATYQSPNLFANFQSWNSSTVYEHHGYKDILEMSAPQIDRPSEKAFSQIVDINGDGLPDFLRYYFNEKNTADGWHGYEYFAVLLNTGDNFSTAYKCVIDDHYGGNTTYYGDCAK